MLWRMNYLMGGIAIGALLAPYGYFGWRPAMAQTDVPSPGSNGAGSADVESAPQGWSFVAEPKIVRELKLRDDLTAKELALILRLNGRYTQQDLARMSPMERAATERNSDPVVN